MIERKISINTDTDTLESVDFRKFILFSRESSELVEKMRKTVEESGFELTPFTKSKTLFTLDKFKISLDEAIEISGEMDDVKNHIKRINLQSLIDKNGNLTLDRNLSFLISSFIAQTNKNGTPDKGRALGVLQNILCDLNDHEIEGVEFVDRESLDSLAEAIVSKTVEDAQLNLDAAMMKVLIQIRKISLLWFYESTCFNYYNLNFIKKGIIEKC